MISKADTQFNEWTLLQMADSSLPVGGFVASFGLEAAHQMGGLDLEQFLKDSVQVVCYSCLPVIEQTLSCMSTVALDHAGITENDERLNRLLKIDFDYESFVGTNHVNSRASVMQGSAYLTLISKSFSHSRGAALVDSFKMLVRKRKAFGHFVVAYAMACYCLEIELQKAEFLFLFMHVRTIISSAIRLGIIGPYVGQTLISNCKLDVERIIQEYRTDGSKEPVLTSPLLEIIQASHDKLYTRIFNS